MVLRTVFSIFITLIQRIKNPFAYFTQIIHYAFLRRIQKEKKQLDIKNKIIEKTGFDEVMHVDETLEKQMILPGSTVKVIDEQCLSIIQLRINIAQKKNR